MAKRRKNKESNKSTAAAAANGGDHSSVDDGMTQCVAFCQEQRWREALLLCLERGRKAEKKGQSDIAAGLAAAKIKIDRSLRREMTDALIKGSAELLDKEYLLDVSE